MDPDLELSDATLQALQAFIQERQQHEDRFQKLQQQAEKEFDIGIFEENWQLSQFWYDDDTALTLAKEALEQSQQRIGFISSPSAFVAFKKHGLQKDGVNINLFEFDKRFHVYPEFVHYDFNHPLQLPDTFLGAFDVLVCDPPFLSQECLEKMVETIRYLGTKDVKVIYCTGDGFVKEYVFSDYDGLRDIIFSHIMADLVGRWLGADMVDFEPKHSNGLSNEFRCYVNYDSSNTKFCQVKQERKEE